LISPLTGNLNVGGNTLQNISAGTVGSPGAYFNNDSNTGLYASAADTVDITAGGIRSASFATVASGVNYVNHTPAVTTAGPIVAAAGTDTDIELNVTGKGAYGTLFNTNSGSPKANNMYRGAVVKGWLNFNGTGTIAIRSSYNVTSITDDGTGDYTVTWDTDFADTNYIAVASCSDTNLVALVTPVSAGTLDVKTDFPNIGLADCTVISVIAIGAQ
jgi:hypothetical protein